MTPALADAVARAYRRVELVDGDVLAAFDRLGVGLEGRALRDLIGDDPTALVAMNAVIVCVEADRAQRAMLARHAKAYAKADRQWRRDVDRGQLALDGIEPARYVQGESITHRQKLRVELWVRARGACEDCGRDSAGVALDVHHLSYDRYGYEDLSDVLLICRDCHERRHGHRIPA